MKLRILKIFCVLFCVLITLGTSVAQVVTTDEFTQKSVLLSEETETPSSSVVEKKEHSPQKAMIYEALLPGLGHIYNKKAWHIPIVYAAFGTSLFFIFDNSKKYKKYRNAYADFSVYMDYLGQAPQYPFPIKEPKLQRFREVRDYEFERYSKPQLDNFKRALKNNKDAFRRYRDLSYISLAAVYILNLVWVTTDAHFFYYDVSDNLSLQVQPQMLVLEDYSQGVGVNLVFKF